MIKTALTILLLTPALFAAKTDDALAAAQAQVKAQALTIEALTKAVAKTNVDAKARAVEATQQRETASEVAAHNVVHAEQAVSKAEETSVRVEAKTDAAVASADHAAKTSESNNALIYAGLLTSILTFLGVALQSVLKYLSDGRILAAANVHQREVVDKLDTVTEQTNGMTERLEKLAGAAGHAQGVLDGRDAGRTGD